MISQINKYIIRSGDEFLILFSYFINIQSGQRSLQTGSYDYPGEWTGRTTFTTIRENQYSQSPARHCQQ